MVSSLDLLALLTSMTEDQIKMLQLIIRQEIQLAGIDGLYDHGVAAWTERMLDENWEEFRKSFEAQ